MASPNIKIAGNLVVGNLEVVSNTTYTITLNSTVGVSSWVLTVASMSDNVILSDYTLTKTNETTYTFLTPNKPLNGFTVRFKSQVNNGLNAGVYDPSLTTTLILYEKANGLRLLAPGETTEIDSLNGWTKTLNEIITTNQDYIQTLTLFSDLQNVDGPATVYIKSQITATSSINVPSDVSVVFIGQGSIYANSNVHVHFRGKIQADNRCFYGPGFCSVAQKPIDPLWWGGNSDLIAWECRFDKPGIYNTNTYFASDGAEVVCTRAGNANHFDNYSTTVASANQMRITGNGILVEPACTQILTSTDFTSALWVNSTEMPTKTGVQLDPFGGTNAVLVGEGTANSGHQLYNLVTLSGTTVFSVYVKYGTARYVRIGDNGFAHLLKFDFTTGAVTVSGAGATGYAESLGGTGWYRLVLVMTTPTSGLVSFAHLDAAGTSASFTGTSRYTILAFPQCEAQALGRASSWISTGTRAADVVTVSGPKVSNRFCVDVDFRTAETFDRIGLCPLLSVGTYGAAESFCLSMTSSQKANFSIFDAVGEANLAQNATFSGTGGGCVSGAIYTNTGGIQINGSSVAATASGAGTYRFRGVYPLVFRVGQASTGLQSSFEIKRIAVRDGTPASTVKADFIYNYTYPLGHKASPRSKQPIFLGDSNTQAPGYGYTTYPQKACDVINTYVGSYVPQNYGIGGNTTCEMRSRYARELSNAYLAGYRQIYVWGGINDVNNLITTSTTIDNLLYIYNSILYQGLKLTPITVMAGNNAVTLPKIQEINAFIAAYCAAGSTYRGSTSPIIGYVNAFSILGDNGSSSTKIATAYDMDGGSLHINQDGHTLLSSHVLTEMI